MMVQLDVENLKVYYLVQKGSVRAVDSVSFSLKEGESLGIVGESGCGKSTLGLSLIRLVPSPGKVLDGKVKLNGKNILEIKEDEFRKEIRWKRVSMVFQWAMNALNPVYTVGYQLSEPLIYHYSFSKEKALEKALQILELVGLKKDIAKRYPHELSGGMRQRVIIAMALLLKPEILIADEPTTALDVIVQANVINLLKKLKKELGLSIILITHDLAIISEIAEKISIMYAGKIVEFGEADKIYKDPKHPYTKKLLAAVPRIKAERKIEFITGMPPDLLNPPKGCRFNPRCPYVMDICKEKEPEVIFENGNSVSCWLYGK